MVQNNQARADEIARLKKQRYGNRTGRFGACKNSHHVKIETNMSGYFRERHVVDAVNIKGKKNFLDGSKASSRTSQSCNSE